MDNKIYNTDKAWYDEAKKAIAELPPRASEQKILKLIELWNDRVPEFFRRPENPEQAKSQAACGQCVGRYMEVFKLRFEMLEKQFASAQQEVVVEENKLVRVKRSYNKKKK